MTYTLATVEKMEELLFNRMETEDLLIAIVKALDVDTKGDIYEFIMRTYEIQKPRFEVEIIETRSTVVVVEAWNEDEAYEKVGNLYENSVIELDDDDIDDYDITVLDETEEEETI